MDTLTIIDTLIKTDTAFIHDTVSTTIIYKSSGNIFLMISSIISFLSLGIAFFAFQQTKKSVNISNKSLEITQNHQILSTRPYLDFIRMFNFKSLPVYIEITNFGLGPAIIKGIDISVNGNQIDSLKQVYMLDVIKYLKMKKLIQFGTFSIEIGTFFPAGRHERILFTSIDYINITEIEEVIDCFSQIKMKIFYESIYGEKFEAVLPETRVDEIVQRP